MPGPNEADVDAVIAGFGARKAAMMTAVIGATGAGNQWADAGVVKGMLQLEQEYIKAVASRSLANVTAANVTIRSGCTSLDATPIGDSEAVLGHFSACNIIRAYVLYKDRVGIAGNASAPLLETATKTALLASMQRYKTLVFNDNVGSRVGYFGYNPYDPRPINTTGMTGTLPYNGTENHKMAFLLTGLLLAEIFAGDGNWTQGGVTVPIRNAALASTNDRTLSIWHYYRDALYRFLGVWGGAGAALSGGGNRNGTGQRFFDRDVAYDEKDSVAYGHVHMGGWWMLRDCTVDARLRKHGETLIDRWLHDYAEDNVKGIYTGAHGRSYQDPHVTGNPLHIGSYLLFDNLGAMPTTNLINWGRQFHVGILTSDYAPQRKTLGVDAVVDAFPKTAIEVARHKGTGYLVTEGAKKQANWVEKDFALGGYMDADIWRQDVAGGFYMHNGDDFQCSALIPYNGSTGPYRNGSTDTADTRTWGVMTRRVMIQRNRAENTHPATDPPKIWCYTNATLEIVTAGAAQRTGGWLFFQEASSGDVTGAGARTLFVAICQVNGTPSLTTSQFGQTCYTFNAGDNPLVWEVSDSTVHTYAAFKAQVLANVLTVSTGATGSQLATGTVSYTSAATVTRLTFNLADGITNGVTNTIFGGQAWNRADFDHGTHNPWVTNPFGLKTMDAGTPSYLGNWDWASTSTGDPTETAAPRVTTTILSSPGPTADAGPGQSVVLAGATLHTLVGTPFRTAAATGRVLGDASATTGKQYHALYAVPTDAVDRRLDTIPNEWQIFHWAGATSGTATITLDGQTTAALPFNVTYAQIQSAIEALSNMAPGDVIVVGTPVGGTGPATHTVNLHFAGARQAVNVPQITIASSLVGVTDGTPFVFTMQDGGGTTAPIVSAVNSMTNFTTIEIGRRLRWSRRLDGIPAITFVALDHDEAFYHDSASAFTTVRTELAAKGFNRPDRNYAVWYEGRDTQDAVAGRATVGSTVGQSGLFAVLFMDTGQSQRKRPGGSDIKTSAFTPEVALAHEILHNLGAMSQSAPNRETTTTGGHAAAAESAGTDIMAGNGGVAPRVLDFGRNDYYAHSGAWLDAEDHPIWQRTPAAVVSRLWTQLSGPAVTLVNPTTDTPTFTTAVAGVRPFRYLVTDADGLTAFEDVVITSLSTEVPVVPTWVPMRHQWTTSASTAKANLVIEILGMGAGQQQYLDVPGLFPGWNVEWSRGGLDGLSVVYLYRSDNPDVSEAEFVQDLVRYGGPVIPGAADSSVEVVDREMPLGVPIAYDGRSVITFAEGVELVTNGDQVSLIVPAHIWWLTDPLDPTLDVPLSVRGESYALTHSAEPIAVGGRSTFIVSTVGPEPRSSPRLNLQAWSLDKDERARIDAILSTGRTLLLRDMTGDKRYVRPVGDEAWNRKFRTDVQEFSVSLVEVDVIPY